MTHNAVLLDTSFFLRFLNDSDPLFKNAADMEKAVEFYLSSDTESFKIYKLLKEYTTPKFQFIDLNTPHSQTFGILDF